MFLRVRDAVEGRLGRLTPSDRGLLRRIAQAVDQAQRVAGRIVAGEGRAPYPGEIPRLPGTADVGPRRYTYTTIVSDPDAPNHRVWATPVVFTTDRILTRNEIEALAISVLGRGQVAEQYQARVPGLMEQPNLDVTLISVYRGTLNVVP